MTDETFAKALAIKEDIKAITKVHNNVKAHGLEITMGSNGRYSSLEYLLSEEDLEKVEKIIKKGIHQRLLKLHLEFSGL